MLTEEYSGSRIMRRCGQLGIPYQTVVESPYFRERDWQDGKFKIQFQDGKNGTVGWGKETEPIPENRTTPHNYDEMLSLLGLST